MISSTKAFLLLFACIIIGLICASSSSSSSILVEATAPPHGHKPLKSNDPKLKHDHSLAKPIPHVFDVRADYINHYLRPVPKKENRMVLVVLYSSWCGEPCDKWRPVLKQIALMTREAQIAHRLTIIKHDVTKDDVIAHKLKVEGFPAVGLVEAAYHREWEFKKYTGDADAEAVVDWMESQSPDHFLESHAKLKTSISRSKSV